MLAHYDVQNGTFSFGEKTKEISENTLNALNKLQPGMIATCDNFEKLSKKLGTTDEDFINFCTSLKKGDIQLKQGQTYLQAYEAQLKSTSFSLKSIGASAKTFFGSLGAGLINTLGGMAIGALISGGISLVGKLIDSLVETEKEIEEIQEKAIETANETRNAIDSIKSEIESTASTVDEVAERYARLAQEVGSLNQIGQNQGTLSNDEYQEFLDISNQLAELFPQLTIGYDENGNALLDLSGNISAITDELYRFVEAEKAVASAEMQEKMPDLFEAYTTSVNADNGSYSDKYNEQFAELQSLEAYYNNILDSFNNKAQMILPEGLSTDKLLEILELSGLDPIDFTEYIGYEQRYNFSNLTEEQIDSIRETYSILSEEYSNELEKYKNFITNENKNLGKYIISSLQGDSNYEGLGDVGKQIADSIFMNIGYDTALSEYDNWNEVYTDFIQNGILNSIQNIDSEQIQQAIIDILTDPTLSASEYQAKVRLILNYDTANNDVDFSQWGIYDVDNAEITKKANETTKRLIDAYGGTQSDNNILASFVNNLEPAELDALEKLPISKESVEQSAVNFIVDLDKEIRKQTAKEIDIDVATHVDLQTSADSMKSAFADLQTALSDYQENGLEGMDISNLTKLGEESTFGNINGSTAAYEKFLAVMQDVDATAEDVQKAFDDLATSYIYGSELAEQITEDNVEWVASQLEKNNVTNASAVAEQMLINKLGAEKIAINECINANLTLNGVKLTSENASQALENATLNEIASLINEADAAGESTTALQQYLFEKMKASDSVLTTDGDISNLMGLGKAIGTVGRLMSRLIELKAALANANNSYSKTRIQAEIDALESTIEANIAMGKKTNTIIGGGYSGGSSSGGSGGSGGGSSSSTETSETFDWVETKITRLEEAISRLDKIVDSTYNHWTTRNSALSQQISKVREEIALQEQAYYRYIHQANSLGLSTDYVLKIQNGELNIETIKDEGLIEKINLFQEWYNKAVECADAMQELGISLGELAEQQFDNISKEYSDVISLIEGSADLVDERINRTEEQGYFVSSNYYKQMLNYENQEMAKLKEEYNKLIAQRNSAVSSGMIIQGSEAYQSMTKEIQDIQKAIEESTTSIVEFNNAIRDLNWEIFDYIEERIGKITDESNFLIDLLDNQSLYNDNGSFNKRGQAAAYLHGQNVKVYTQQAKDYANELKKVNAELEKDKSNKNLIERREELLQLQQESISNIYAEKEAVKSLVEEGIINMPQYFKMY